MVFPPGWPVRIEPYAFALRVLLHCIPSTAFPTLRRHTVATVTVARTTLRRLKHATQAETIRRRKSSSSLARRAVDEAVGPFA